MNTFLCPWCSYPLLRQLRFGKPSWFCLHCKRDIPYSCDNTLAAQDEVEEILKRYQLLSENSHEIVLFLEQDGKIKAANSAACQAYGYERHELLSLQIQDLQSWGTQTQLLAPLTAAENQSRVFETRHHRKDGSTFPVEVTFQGVGIGEDRILLNIIRDLTGQKQLELLKQQQVARERLIRAMPKHIYQSLNLNEILNATVTEVREFLQAERVIIHRFLPNGDGSVIVESVAPGCPSMLGFMIHDPFILEKNYISQYQLGESHRLSDITQSSLDQRLIYLLTFFQVKARLAIPILQNTVQVSKISSQVATLPNQLWGLLIAHQCSETREWQDAEVDALQVVVTQIAVAIQQSELYQQLQETQQQLQQLTKSHHSSLLSSRSHFDRTLASQWQQMAQEKAPLSLIRCSINFFQQYKDLWGEEAGDRCWQQISQTLQLVANHPQDLVASYSEGEFALLLPRRTAENAQQLAEEIRFRVKALAIPHADSPIGKYVTLSLGVASTIPDTNSDPEQLMTEAVAALQQTQEIRRQGNNRGSHRSKPLPPSNIAPSPQEKPELTTHQDLLMSYVAYYVSRGKMVVSPHSGFLPFTGLVYEYWGYHSEFQAFWQQLQQRRDFYELYLEGDEHCFGSFLGGCCGVGECARCNLPIPITEGSAYTVPSCTLCESELQWEKQVRYKEVELGKERHKTKILAIGTPPANSRNLHRLFLLNQFEVTFASQLQDIVPELLPSAIEMVLIYTEVSEAEGKAWAAQLHSYPQLQGVPIVALSSKAGFSHPWVQRELGVEDYILTPLGGDRLAHHLRSANHTIIQWFPRYL